MKRLQNKISYLSSKLKHQIGSLSWIGVNNFLYKCCEQEELIIKKQHDKKLYNLGLHEHNINGPPNIIQNFSDHTLTPHEISALNKGLNFSILPFILIF